MTCLAATPIHFLGHVPKLAQLGSISVERRRFCNVTVEVLSSEVPDPDREQIRTPAVLQTVECGNSRERHACPAAGRVEAMHGGDAPTLRWSARMSRSHAYDEK